MKDRKVRDPKSFDSIEEFARRYNKAYQYYWRYGILNTNSNSDEEYFYLADTVYCFFALLLKAQTWRLIFRLLLTRINWHKKY